MQSLLLAKNPGIEIFGTTIYAYALIIVAGMLLAFFVITALFRRRNMSKDLFLTFFCICLPICLVTTRLFYCITDGMPIEEWFDFQSIRKGGLSIIGGILGGVLSISAVCYFKKINFFRVADCVVIGLLFAQAIGRWGNFANQEVYGAVVENEALQCFPFAVYINKTADGHCLQTFTLTFQKWFGMEQTITGGVWHYAFFFYESLANTIVGVLLFIFAWKNPKKPNGLCSGVYLTSYGVVRSIMEPLRDPTYILGDGVQWSFVFSIVLIILGVSFIFTALYINKRKEGVLMGSLKGDPYAITEYLKDSKDEVAYFDKLNIMCSIYPENYVQKQEKTDKGAEK